MSHETHDTHHEHSESHHSHTMSHGHADAHGHGHHAHTHNTPDPETIAKQARVSFKNAFWLIIIIVGLFIAALNFIQAESHGETEDKAPTREILETGSGHTTKGAENKEMEAAHEAAEKAENQPKTDTAVAPAAEQAAPAEH